MEKWIMAPGLWDNELSETILGEWFAVGTDDDGIVAYFMNEADAYNFSIS